MDEQRPSLTPIDGGKNKRRPAKDGGGEKPARIGKTELCELVSRAMLGKPTPIGKPFPLTLHVLEPNPATRILLEEGEAGVVRVVPARHVASAVVAWLVAAGEPELLMTHRTAAEAVDMWADCAPKLTEVAPLLWPGEPGLTWQRMPWALEAGPAPTWEGVLARMTNADSFCHWIGSLFYPEASLHEYLWCQGTGHDGKGAINRFLARVFGPSYRSKHPPKSGDKFWTHGLIGARLVVLPDCDNSDFVRSGFFKALTGGDPVDVEAKGQMSGTVRLGCKFLVFSNEKPAVGTNKADQRRIVYCEFTSPGEYDAGFEDRLWAEGGAFLAWCVESYRFAYPRHGAIKGDRDQIEEIALGNEDEYQVAFDSFFVAVEPKAKDDGVSHTEASLNAFSIVPVKLQATLKQLFPHQKNRSDFLKWMGAKYGVRKTRFWMRQDGLVGDGTCTYRYVGAILADPCRVYDYVNGLVSHPERPGRPS